MTQVKDLIKYLETLDQDTFVQILEHDDRGGYYTQGGTCAVIDLDLDNEHHMYVESYSTKDGGTSKTLLIGHQV
jgi:hypothetical protein